MELPSRDVAPRRSQPNPAISKADITAVIGKVHSNAPDTRGYSNPNHASTGREATFIQLSASGPVSNHCPELKITPAPSQKSVLVTSVATAKTPQLTRITLVNTSTLNNKPKLFDALTTDARQAPNQVLTTTCGVETPPRKNCLIECPSTRPTPTDKGLILASYTGRSNV